MQKKEYYQKQLAEIKREEDVSKAISKLADISYEMGEVNCQEIVKLTEEVSKIKTVLCGNGNPSSSLLVRMDRFELAVENMGKDLNDIKVMLIGDLGGKTVPISKRVHDVEKAVSNMNWLTKATVATLVGYILTQIFGLL